MSSTSTKTRDFQRFVRCDYVEMPFTGRSCESFSGTRCELPDTTRSTCISPQAHSRGPVCDHLWYLGHVFLAAGAARVLEAAAREFPQSVGVRVALSQARQAEGASPKCWKPR